MTGAVGPDGGGSTAAAAAAALSSRLAAVSLDPPAAAAAAAAAAAKGSSCRVAGLEAPLQALRELIGWPVTYAAEAEQLGVSWPRGLLLHGPPGCGKTLLVQEVAGAARLARALV
jgi:ATP-dependent 26S proteasome regulatory subunit